MDYLVHHGILGMKWGVRRYQNPDGSLTEAGKKRLTRFKNAKNSWGKDVIDKNLERKKSRYDNKPTERNAKRLKKAEIAKEYWKHQTDSLSVKDTLKLKNLGTGNKLSQWDLAHMTLLAIATTPLNKISNISIEKGVDRIQAMRVLEMQRQHLDEINRINMYH